MANRHVIGKNNISIEIDDVGLAFETQNMVSDLCRTTLYPALDKLFDRYVPENEHWKIDDLTLDLGDLPAENWQKVFIRKTMEQMEEQLREKLRKEKFISDTGKETSHNASITSIDIPVEAAFLKFLQTGSRAWNSPVRTIPELEKGLNISEKLIGQIAHLVQQDQAILTRLVWQFSVTFIEAILNKSAFKNTGNYSTFNTLFTQKSWKDAFKKSDFSEQKRKQLENYYWLAQRLQTFPANTNEEVLVKAMQVLLSEKQQKIWIESIQNDINEPVLKKISKKLILKSNDDLSKKATDDEEGIYIEQAGLVLLHPFLSMFFEKTDLLDNNQWKSPTEQRRAVLLCHYLVCGQNTADETDLSLHKILCGLPLTTPIENEFEPTEIEKIATENLLSAVLEYWTSLKSTRSDELRGSFLVREGKLSHRNNNWFLKVEQRSYDMLLDQLPWGISMIRNVFMPEMLHVEW